MAEFLVRDGILSYRNLAFRAQLGRGGVSDQKREGDGATPRTVLKLERVLYRADRLRPPVCAVPVEPLAPDEGWCDDPADAAYNRPVRLPYAGRHETLWRTDGLYDVIGVLDWNLHPVVPGRGSAIFLHAATADLAPTAGCVALALPDLLACLAAGLSAIRVV